MHFSLGKRERGHTGLLQSLGNGAWRGARYGALLLFALSGASLPAAQLKEARVSQVIKDVKLLPPQAAPRPAAVSDEVRSGTAVRTGIESRAELTFTDQTLARLGANTIFSFNEGTRNLELGSGAILLRVPKNAGGAEIKTSLVTAAVTGTTIMLEYHPDAYIKFIVLEGTGRMFRKDHLGESVLINAGQMLIVDPRSLNLPNPVDVDVKRLIKTSKLIKDYKPIPSGDLIDQEIQSQLDQKSKGSLVETNLVIFGGGTAVTLTDTIDQRIAAVVRPPPAAASTPIPPPTPAPVAIYHGATGNWSDPNRWMPAIVPNNGNQGVDYDVSYSTGPLTQDIAAGVTINRLLMSGGTLVLANPLTLKLGLQFSGGAITLGTLNVAGNSTQSARMTVAGTKINNSGSYDITLANGNAFSGGNSTFNNSGTLTGKSLDGTISFNIPLNNTGAVSAERNTLSLVSGGSNSGTLSAAAGALLRIDSNFSLTDGTHFSGDGSIQFGNGTSTSLSGTIANSGHVLLDSSGSLTDFVLHGDVTLAGMGTLTLTKADRILGTGILTNAGNTIAGETSDSGSLGANAIGIVNQTNGMINANVEGLALNVDPGSSAGLTNKGSMEASNGGFLVLDGHGGGDFANSGGIIAALDGSEVQLSNGATIMGGTLTTAGTGVIRSLNTATLVSLTNAGVFEVTNNTAVNLVGTITNRGSILIDSTGDSTDLVLSGDLTLNGGGSVTLLSAGRIGGSGVLINVDNKIVGETSNGGSLGANAIGILNQANGSIDANVSGLILDVDPDSGGGLINNGMLEASGGGILRLNGNGGGSFTNNNLIEALDSSQVQLINGASIFGGTLLTAGTGTIQNAGTATLSGLTNAGVFIANNSTTTTLVGPIVNSGSITLDSTGGFTDLSLNGDVTLSGGGTVNLANAARILGSGVLTTDNLIQGETGNGGSLGANAIGIINQTSGMIVANVNGLILDVDPSSASGLVNNGIMEASSGGILRLNGNGGGTFSNNNLIQALDGSVVQLSNGATIIGGTLQTADSGTIQNVNTATLNNLTNAGTFIGNDGTATTLVGTMTNTGVISLNSAGNFTDLLLGGNVTLTGAGTVNLSGADRILGSGILTNVNNLIQGDTNSSGGGLGANQIGVINQASGVINANHSGLALNVDPNAANGLVNHGLMEASNGGILLLNGNGGGGFTNTGATITAQNGSTVQLTNSASVTGGTLSTVGTGVLQNLNTAALTSLTLAGNFLAGNSTVTTVGGLITNTGLISLNSTGNFTDLVLNGNVTLTGSGTINLTSADRILGSGILTNTNNLIQGDTNSGGGLGTNQIGIVNQAGGIINADHSGLVLNVDPNPVNGLINQGLMEATSGGILLLNGNGGGGFTNAGATITAQNGSTVELTNGASVTGGTLSTVGTGVLQNLNTATLTSLTLAGNFVAADTTTTTLNGAIVNTGNISIGSTGNFTDLLLGSNVTLTGGGVINLVNADRVYGSGILTNTNNTIQGETHSGSLGNNGIGIVNQAGGTISANVSGQTLNVDPNFVDGLVNQGTMQAINSGILLLNGNGGGTFTNGGTIKASGGTLQFSGTVTSSGTVDVGADSLSVTGSYTQSAGTFRLAGGNVTSTSALDFEGGLVDAWGTINAAIMNNAVLQPALGGTGLTVNGDVTLLTSSQLTFQLGGLTQGSEYGHLNVNGSLALGGQLVLTFVNGFQNLVTGNDSFSLLSSLGVSVGGRFTNVAPGGRLETNDGFGSFQVDYGATAIFLSNFIPSGGQFLDFAGLNSTTGAGGNGHSLAFSAPAVIFGAGAGEFHGASFNGGNAAPGTVFLGGDGGSFAATATAGDVIVNSDIEASSGANGKDAIGGKGGSVALTSNSGQVAINSRIQVSHNTPGRRSASGGSITLKSGRTSGVAINVANTGQLLALLDAAASGPGGKIIIQATAPTGNSQVNVSGLLQADRGTVDIRHSGSSGQINLTNADIRADTLKVAALGNNGVLQVGGGSLSADTTLQLYAPDGNGQVVFVGNVSLNGASTKSIAGNSVTINNGVLVNVTGPKASVYVNSTGSIPNANYSGFGGNGHTTGTFGGSGANAPQPLSKAPPLGLPPGG